MIVRMLQLYKPSWQIVLNKKIHLDFKDGEIKILIGYPNDTWEVDKEVVHNFNFASPLLPSEFHRKVDAWQRIKIVDEWMENLTLREREAIFYRYINHDFEPAKVIDEINHGMIFKTLSEYEIAQKMNISRSSVQTYIQRALQKIQELAGSMNKKTIDLSSKM